LPDTEQFGRFGLFQAVALQDRVDLEDQLRLDEVFLGVRHTDVLEDIPPANFVSLPRHAVPLSSLLSNAIRSASWSRLLINSMSLFGVLRPVFDFFWKT
jgi:hypothetical protein